MPLGIQLMTLVIPRRGDEVLLGTKREGFGKGMLNGFGGKVEFEEDITAAAIWELKEECGLTAIKIEKRGILNFWFNTPAGEISSAFQVHVFETCTFTGKPTATEEMGPPEWVSLGNPPFERMWPDDPHWYPYFRVRKRFKGDFEFSSIIELTNWHVGIEVQLPKIVPVEFKNEG